MSQDQDTNPNAVYEEKYAGMTTIEVIRAMDKLSGEKESIEDELKEINKEYDFLRLNLIPKKFEDDGIENLRVEGIGRVSLTGDMYVSIPAAMREQAYEYFRDIGKSSLITTTINSSTLKAAVKAMVKSGEDIPEELIKITPFTRASITRK